MRQLSRRHFFFGSFAIAAAAGCGPKSAHRVGASSRRFAVSAVRAASYSAGLVDIIRRLLTEHAVQVRDQRIVLKPNLVEFDPGKPINTHPLFVASVLEAFRSLGARSVRIAEGPGHRRPTLDMAEAAGFFSAISRFEDHFTDLNVDDVRPVRIIRPFSTLKQLYLPNVVFDCDLLVSLPKMKTHHWAGATLSMKNLFGVVPGAVYGWPKNVLHLAGINECVADLHSIFPRQFSIVDGIEAMEGNGPILGTTKHMGVVVAGWHAPSVDATCCQAMQIDPEKIGYLQLITKRTGWEPGQVAQIAEPIKSVSSPFALMPEFGRLRAG